MPLVVDASVALAWALPDESSVYADAVLAVVEQDWLIGSWTLAARGCQWSGCRLCAQAHHVRRRGSVSRGAITSEH